MRTATGRRSRFIRLSFMSGGEPRVLMILLIIGATLMIIAAIAVSPLLLTLWEEPKGINWNQLSNIGQTYSAASAVLAALALTGVAGSLVFQARQGRTESIQHTRDRQYQLLMLAMENPSLYGPILGGWPAKTDDELRRFLFSGLWASGLRTAFEMNTISETETRKELQDAFATKFGRAWWDASHHMWISDHSTSRAERRFARMVSEEYGKSISGGPPTDHQIIKTKPEAAENSKRNALAGIAVGLCVGFLAGSRIRSAKQ
jgi:hypothetical protein